MTVTQVRDSLEGWLAGSSIPCADSRPARAVLAQVSVLPTVYFLLCILLTLTVPLTSYLPLTGSSHLAQLEREEHERGRHDYTATQCKWGVGERARAVRAGLETEGITLAPMQGHRTS